MKTTGILFKADMVRAILQGRKTLTSRLSGLDRINHHPDEWTIHGSTECGIWVWNNERTTTAIRCRYGVPGDILIGRETWGVFSRSEIDAKNPSLVIYRTPPHGERLPLIAQRWRPSIHMPYWASRLHLEITAVWPSRLQDMTEEEAMQEGVIVTEAAVMNERLFTECRPDLPRVPAAVEEYAALWDRINGEKPGQRWADNPWCWRIMFKRVFREAEDFGRCQNPAWPEPATPGDRRHHPKDHAGRETARDSALVNCAHSPHHSHTPL